MSLRIVPVPTPESASEEPSWLLVGSARVDAVVDTEIWGDDDLSSTAAEMVAGQANQANAQKFRFVAVDGDDGDPDAVLGSAFAAAPKHDNLSSMNVYVSVDPANRRRGVGSALWDAVLATAKEHERTILQAWSSFGVEPAADDPEALDPPTGSGRVPARDPGTRFALSHGFVLEQAERHSLLRLPVDPTELQRHYDHAAAAAGADYELVSWTDHVPDEWMESFCVLQARMSTDAPSAGLTYEEEAWDADRVRASEKATADGGYRTITVAALHRPSGELAGYTGIEVKPEKPQVGFQETTIVRSEYRGRRLGLLLKAANLRRIDSEWPQMQRIHTWNAEENAYMLNINVALGFRPAGASAAWELRLGS